MATISRTGITAGATIQPAHITNVIDALDGTTNIDIKITGSLGVTGSLAHGSVIIASGLYSHAEGGGTIASGEFSHAEGYLSAAIGSYSHAEGAGNAASGSYSHAEGVNSLASGEYSHAEGYETISSGSYSHSEGRLTLALGQSSHAEGYETQAIGENSHVEGFQSISLGYASHAEGIGTIASGSYQHVSGQYNKHGDSTSLFIIGNGTNNSTRKDAFKVRMSGSIVLPTTQSVAPTWTGTDGEIVPATVSGKYLLYMYMNGAWRSGSFV